MSTCPKCNTQNRPEAKYCKKCKARLGPAQQAAYQPPAQKRRTQVENSSVPRRTEAAPPPGAAPGVAGKGRTVVEGTVLEPEGGQGKPGAGVPGSRPVASSRRLVGWLVTYDLDPSVMDYQIREGRNFVGTDASEVDILIPKSKDKKVTADHCLILYRKGKVKIKDRMSTNGTFVDSITVGEEDYPDLYDGDVEDAIATANFVKETITFVDIQDDQVVLRDNSYIRVGGTVFKIKLIQ